MAITKVNNDLLELNAAQPSITSVGTLTGLTVGGNLSVVSSDSYAIFKMRTDANDDGSNDDGIIQITNGSSDVVKAELRWDESTNTVELGHGDNQGHLVIDSSGRIGINRTPSITGSKLEVGGADNTSLINVEASGVTGGMGIGSTGLQLFHGSSAKVKIDSAGRVTQPYQPAFQVRKNAPQNNIAINTSVTVTWQTEVFDVGSNFASNTFTAPVTGKYQLNVHILIENVDSASAYYQLILTTSNRLYYDTMDPVIGGADYSYQTVNHSVLADMDAGDTAIVTIVQSGGTSQSDLNLTTCVFSGYLVA